MIKNKKWFLGLIALLLIAIPFLSLILVGRLRLITTFESILSQCQVVAPPEKGLFINGSFVEFEQKRWMALRKIEGRNSFIHLASELNGELREGVRLDLGSAHAEDPRLIVFKGQLVVVYNDLVGPLRRVHLAFLQKTDDRFAVEKIQLLSLEGAMQDSEKNWVPFVYGSGLYFIYQTAPWTVLEWHPDGLCTLFAQKDFSLPNLRGGTPAVQIGDEYLSFFHIRSGTTRSYISWNRNIYLMGAYTFDAKPPFFPKRVTVNPLSYPGAYSLLTNYRKTLYPAGLIEKSDSFLVSLGINDDRTEIVTLRKSDLFAALKELKSQ
ncbi:MAG: hypothetical protein ACOYK9_03615 [Chlamydiia bacterium]